MQVFDEMKELMNEVREAKESLASFRKKRNRCRDYTYGRQWNDIIEVDGRKITEYEYILKEGNVPLKNNLIRRIVRNVLGVFRDKLSDIMKEEYGGETAKTVSANSLEELYSRTLEEFLISGMAVHRKHFGYRDGVKGVWTDIVSPGNFFFNTDFRDVRGCDLSMAGQTHLVGFREWCRFFVKSQEEYKLAAKVFENGKRLRITEVWRKEPVARYIIHDRERGYIRKVDAKSYRGDFPKRWVMEETWRYYFLTDEGRVVAEGDSPYINGSHPYVVKCYPFLDGEIQSLVGDMIDQQRYTNRLITLYDWVIRASAKGVLLIPEGAVEPEKLQEVADQWGRFNGVIMYRGNAGLPEPKQISGNVSNLGIGELLEIQLKMMEDVSGVNGVLQGNASNVNTSGELYKSQTANALYSLQDLFASYRTFIRDCAAKDRELLGQINV